MKAVNIPRFILYLEIYANLQSQKRVQAWINKGNINIGIAIAKQANN